MKSVDRGPLTVDRGRRTVDGRRKTVLSGRAMVGGCRSPVTRNPALRDRIGKLSIGEKDKLKVFEVLKVGSYKDFAYKPRQDRKVATVSRKEVGCKSAWPELLYFKSLLYQCEVAARPEWNEIPNSKQQILNIWNL